MNAVRGLIRLADVRRRQLIAICTVAFLASALEAIVLYLVVGSANALAAGTRFVHLEVGGWSTDLAIVRVGVLGAAAIASYTGISVINAWIVARVSSSVLAQLQVTSLESFLDAEWARQSLEPQGRLQDAMTTYTMRVGAGVIALCDLVTAVLGAAALVIAAAALQPVIALLAAVVGAVLTGVLLPIRGLTRRLSEELLNSNRTFGRRIYETVLVARDIDVFAAKREVLGLLRSDAERSRRLNQQTRFAVQVVPYLFQACALGVVLAGLVVAVTHFASSSVQVGSVVLLLVRALVYAQKASSTVQQISDVTPYFDELERVRNLYATSAATRGDSDVTTVTQLALSNVSYRYADRDVLRNVSFSVTKPGLVAIVGPSGSGKSTLVQLIAGLRQPSRGRITIDGVELREVHPDRWARRIGFVPQEVQLIEGTVEDNIRFFRPAISREEIELAAKRAHIDRDIRRLPDGLDTFLSADTLQLSGGQKQRIGLARALAAGPQLLILDEPTSALDMTSERMIQRTLDELARSILLFVVAHRPSTVRSCSTALVVEDGRLTSAGDPADLANTPGFFQQMHQASEPLS